MVPTDPGRLAVVPVKGTVPRSAFPFRNCTVPVGVPAPGGTTVTVAASVPAETMSVMPVLAFDTVRVPLTKVKV